MRKVTTSTRIVLMIVYYMINGSKHNDLHLKEVFKLFQEDPPPMYIQDESLKVKTCYSFKNQVLCITCSNRLTEERMENEEENLVINKIKY